uniref:Uncharacterized protein n=1 Tax=Molossus molossus TaxID=27622 RepID=A0A7J8BN47_MOLMO|nr:hypothetical protein HJG59_010114 [Molossus molossus]
MASLAQIRAPAHKLKGLRFDSWSRVRTWIAGLIPSPGGGRAGGNQLMCLSHINVSLSLPLSLPLYLTSNGQISLSEDLKKFFLMNISFCLFPLKTFISFHCLEDKDEFLVMVDEALNGLAPPPSLASLPSCVPSLSEPQHTSLLLGSCIWKILICHRDFAHAVFPVWNDFLVNSYHPAQRSLGSFFFQF